MDSGGDAHSLACHYYQSVLDMEMVLHIGDLGGIATSAYISDALWGVSYQVRHSSSISS